MFSRIARRATINVRRFSDETETQLETWIKINDRMHLEAASKAAGAVSSVKADVAVLRLEVGSLKNDVSQVKTDMAVLRLEVGSLKNDVSQVKAFRNEVKSEVNIWSELRKGQVEIHKEISAIHKEISAIHKEISNQTRLILAGGAAIASVFFAANQYMKNTEHKIL